MISQTQPDFKRGSMEHLSVLLANFGYNKPLPKYKQLEGIEN